MNHNTDNKPAVDPQEQALKTKRAKKRNKVLIIISVVLAVCLLLGTACCFVPFSFVGTKTDENGKTVNKSVYDAYIGPFFNAVGALDDISFVEGNDDGYYDPNADNLGDLGDFSVGDAPMPDDLPEYEIIDGWFDGNYIADEYEEKVLNVLLIGADTLDGNHARSDTMMLMSINTVKKRIVFTSFMRDSYVAIPGYDNNRLNAAHAKGGPVLLIETIEFNFGIDIDYYAKVDFTSFGQAVDAIGGIDLTVNSDNYNYFYTWSELRGLTEDEATNGNYTVHLDGSSALQYARNRSYYDGDFTRTLHQRDLLTQFVNNCKGSSFEELSELIQAVLPYMVTDMPKDVLQSHILSCITYVSYNVGDARVPCAGSHENLTLPSGAAVLNINIPANKNYVKAKIYG